jgi:signal transduction histidine kinase
MAFAISWAVLHLFTLINAFSWQAVLSMGLALLLVPLGVLARQLSRRRDTQAGALILLAGFALVVTANTWLVEGVFAAVAPLMVLLVIMAGMLLGAKGGYLLAVMAGALWMLTRAMLDGGMISPAPLPDQARGLVVMAIMLLSFLFVAQLNRLANRELRQALDEATHELVDANRRLHRASRLKSQFTARTSHELRTPLTSIMMITDLTLRQVYGPLNERQERNLERLMYSARRLNGLINDILDLSKIEAGRLEIVVGRFAVSNLVECVITALELPAKEKGVSLSCHISPQMPGQVVADEKRLAQVLVNLVDNALKFTDAGEVRLRIERLDQRRWQIEVSDTGRGIHQENLGKIFEAFQQESTEEGIVHPPGTGLGLAICRQLVQMMQGEINVESVVGQGSAFRVILPLRLPVES